MKRLVLIAVALLAAAAWADAVELSVNNRAMVGQALPSVSVHIREPIAGFQLVLTRGDGKVVDVKGGGKPGVTRVIDLPQGEGVVTWKGTLTVNLPRGDSASMALEFETQLLGPLKFLFDKAKDVDLAARTLTFRLNQPAARAELRVLMDTGSYAFDGEVPFDGAPAGTPLTVTWPEAKGQVMKIVLRAWATSQQYDGVELTPWHLDIPHEEVNFDSGRWELRADEQPKVDQSYALIRDAVAKFGGLATLRLYVAGHTDSVGPAQANRALSLNRARAIAQHLRKRGLRIAIYVEGFGEEAPLVGTPDETAEPRNRRAEYVLTIDEPQVTAAPFAPRWQKL
jgi:outer membrane protein OmpA-like peptidoglycan-associated protein